MLNNSSKSGHPCLVPDLRGNAFSFVTLRIMFALVYHIWPLLCWGRFLLCPFFLKSFNHKWVLNFFKGFFCIYWDYHMVFIFQFVNIVYHIDWFAYIKNSCIPGINPTWSWCMSFLMCCWILFSKIFLRIFASMFISGIGLYSFCCFCLVLVSGWWWPHRMSLEVFLPLQFLNKFWKDRH